MAVADADHCFISVEVGAFCSSSDSNVFKNYWRVILNIPDPRVLPSDAEGLSMSLLLVGDEAIILASSA